MTADYTSFEAIYRQDASVSGWNDPVVDREVQGYLDGLLEHSGVVPPARLLEIGSGMGNLSLPLAHRGYHVTGIDISATAIDAAARRAASCGVPPSYIAGDLAQPAAWLGLQGFDAVIDGLCLHCIIGADRPRLLRHVREALRPGGSFLVATMCGEPRSAELRWRFDPTTRWVMGRASLDDAQARAQPCCYLGRPEDLLREVAEAGLLTTHWRVQSGNDATGDQDMLLAVARA